MQIYIICFLLISFSYSSLGQEFAKDEVKVLKKNERVFGGTLLSEGFSLDYRRLFQKTVSQRIGYSIEFGRFKHIKEKKRSTISGDNIRYTYGKLNTLFFLKSSFSTYKVLADKHNINNVSIHWVSNYGLTFGLLKPVYFDIRYKIDPGSPFKEIIIRERFDASKHTVGNISGQSKFKYGLKELSVIPGLHYKTGFQFEYGNDRSKIKALEVGASFDWFIKTPEIMAVAENSSLFINLYLSFQVGKLW